MKNRFYIKSKATDKVDYLGNKQMIVSIYRKCCIFSIKILDIIQVRHCEYNNTNFYDDLIIAERMCDLMNKICK